MKGCNAWQQEGNTLVDTGQYSAAAQAFRKALSLAEASNVSPRQLMVIYTSLASSYTLGGHFAESARWFRRALAVAEKTEGVQSIDYALLFANLSLLPPESGRKPEAIAILREAIAVNGRRASKRDLAVARDNLVKLLLELGRFQEAESVLLDSEAAFIAAKDADAEEAAELLNDFGALRHYQGRYEEAAAKSSQAVEILKKVLGESHPSLVVPMNNLGIIYTKLGRIDQADLTFQQAASLCAKTLGEDHPSCGAILGNYAVVLKRLGRKRESREMAARSQQILQESNRSNGIGSTVSVADLR